MNAPAAHFATDLSTFLRRLRCGTALDLGDVHVVPLFSDYACAPVALLEEALARREARVTEITEQGRVGLLQVDNLGSLPLLLLDGEQVVGAKQDRVFNASFLVPAKGSIHAPVSCVERGRWSAVSPNMISGEATLTPSIRAGKLRSVAGTLASAKSYAGDQGRVWRDVDHYAERTGTGSQTMSFAHCMRARPVDDARAQAIAPLPGQIGIAVVRGDVVTALDGFGSPDLYARSFRKIARGVLGEIGARVEPTRDPQRSVARAIDHLAIAPIARCDAPGHGETLSVSIGRYALTGLAHRGQVFHVLATSAA